MLRVLKLLRYLITRASNLHQLLKFGNIDAVICKFFNLLEHSSFLIVGIILAASILAARSLLLVEELEKGQAVG